MPDATRITPLLVSELEACAPSRDHPFIAALVAGRATPAQLRELARQQWIFHQRFPPVLATLASRCAPADLAARVVAEADAQAGRDGPSRAERWAPIAAALGVDRAELADARALPTTEAMLETQAAVAALPHPAGYVAIQIGVNAESLPHMHARRAALVERYGVAAALADGYFGDFPGGDVVDALLAPVAGQELDPTVTLDALRVVLRARWAYFDGISTGTLA